MTLLEVLIAMIVLLVGIYAVAQGFPKLLQNIRGEGDRTIMARLTEAALERVSSSDWGPPDAITGGGSLSPFDLPKDLSDTARTANALENMRLVMGETFRVPAPHVASNATSLPTGAMSIYVLQQGPAALSPSTGSPLSGYPSVYLLVPLHEQKSDPNSATPGLDENAFYVDTRSGTIITSPTFYTYDGAQKRPWSYSYDPQAEAAGTYDKYRIEILTDYAWAEGDTTITRPVVHYVQAETVNNVTSSGNYLQARVHPAHFPTSGAAPEGGALFGQILPGQTRAWAKIYLNRETNAGTSVTWRGRYVLDNNYGLTLKFHPMDAGLTLKVDYQLRADAANRRLLLMAEDQPIQGTTTRTDANDYAFTDLRLTCKGVDAQPFLSRSTLDTTLTTPVHVLAVDLTTGNTYTDGAPLTLEDANLSPALAKGYQNGLLSLPIEDSGGRADYISHVWRFYYRTVNRNTVQVQVPPKAYIDSVTALSYQGDFLSTYPADEQDGDASLARIAYRTYKLIHTPASDPTLQIASLQFGLWTSEKQWTEAKSSAGATVAVNYAYWYWETPTTARQQLVWGELHTVDPAKREVALNHATLKDYPVTILAVNGVSARARGFWLNNAGVPKTVDVETCFLPGRVSQTARAK